MQNKIEILKIHDIEVIQKKKTQLKIINPKISKLC